MKRIAVETILVEREFLVDIPNGEIEEQTRQRVLKREDDGVVILPNSDRFVESVGVVLRDLKDGETEDFVLVQMRQHAAPPTKTDAELAKKRGRPRKTELDTEEKPAIIGETSKSELIKQLLGK